MFIPDPDLDFLPIPDPAVKKAPDPGNATLLRTLNTTEIVNYRIHRYEEKAFRCIHIANIQTLNP
jgi:hypothetical protein